MTAKTASAICVAQEQSTRIDNVGIIGQGDVVGSKIWPALKSLSACLDAVAVCSIESSSRLAGLHHNYCRIDASGVLPLNLLDDLGLLRNTLWVIATPSEFHVHYALQLAGLVRVAIEKPIARDSEQAKRLLPLEREGFEVFACNHKLSCRSALNLVDRCRLGLFSLADVGRVEGIFYEAGGFAIGRQPEDTIADIQYHLFTIILAAFKVVQPTVSVGVDEVKAATHEADGLGRFLTPEVWTASRIRGRLYLDKSTVAYDLKQAKGAPKSEKLIRFFDKNDALIEEVRLDESGSAAHGRMIGALLQPTVDVRQSLSDAVAVMKLIDASRSLAMQESPYQFGRLPNFLR